MKQITVMGIPYEIIQLRAKDVIEAFKKGQHLEEVKKLVGDEGQHFAGLCDAQLNKIYLNSELPGVKIEKTFIHEFVEAIDQESCLELTHVQMQAITNAFFLAGIVNVKELLKNEPEDIEISITTDSAG
jgi:hypothetical protein